MSLSISCGDEHGDDLHAVNIEAILNIRPDMKTSRTASLKFGVDNQSTKEMVDLTLNLEFMSNHDYWKLVLQYLNNIMVK